MEWSEGMKKSLGLMLGLCLIITTALGGCKDSAVAKMNSKELKNTVMSSHMENKIIKGKNLVYCSTFQLAWNELKKNIIKEDIKLTDEPNIVPLLNKSLSTKKDLSDKDYVAMVGFGRDKILDKINEELKKKFGSDAPKVEEKLEKDDILAYAYLYKNLKFKNEFEKLKEPIKFITNGDTVDVKGFGLATTNDNGKRYEIARQVAIIDYKSDDDFIVKLVSESDKDEIILAKMDCKNTLLNTINDVSGRVKGGKEESFGEKDILKIPSIEFNINHSYEELVNKYLKNKGFEDYMITKAVQDVRFKLNEKGAQLRSEARLIGTKSSAPIVEKPKNLVFDKPYLIMLREKGAKYPYFAMWVENPLELNEN